MPTTTEPTTPTTPLSTTQPEFVARHLGSGPDDVQTMLDAIGCDSLDTLIDQTVPEAIRLQKPMQLTGLTGPTASEQPLDEHHTLEKLHAIASQNRVVRSCIGMGYYGTITPSVIRRNILENPGWYTQYTPYQAEIAQGRLEALLTFQTMIADLTGLPLANSSLLDEATAAAEAMAMCFNIARGKRAKFFVADDAHPQTIGVMATRARTMAIELVVGNAADAIAQDQFADGNYCGALIQYPNTYGAMHDPTAFVEQAHNHKTLVVAAVDPLAMLRLASPGSYGIDIAIGSAQRFGVPMGGGGPHAGFLATNETYARKMPGRIVGVSRDKNGQPAYRLAIQTREQHIKRDRATSNICTAQVLLAIIAGMYAVYHGPEGLRRIAARVHGYTAALKRALESAGFTTIGGDFDTLTIETQSASQTDQIIAAALQCNINLRRIDDTRIGVSFDELTDHGLYHDLCGAFGIACDDCDENQTFSCDTPAPRTDDILTHEVFHRYHAEHEMLRYLKRLESRDLSLTTSMIPLGSCTMKLNASSEMLPITWPQFSRMHPFAPIDQQAGSVAMCQQLEQWLCEITGFAAVSLQPNAGSQGEYAGLLAIRRYHESRGDMQRNVCLIPVSAHGTNPASAVIAGFEVVPVGCDKHGNIDAHDLQQKAQQHADRLGAMMITYPSTHGVFEPGVRDLCKIIHDHGGLVYLDGANMNAQVGLTCPGTPECEGNDRDGENVGGGGIGADVCHLNLHKTFCIPHGGGGPGMGPIGVAKHLAPFLPGDPRDADSWSVSAAPYGSTSILPISWMYIAMMGGPGLTDATRVAILNANYMATRLSPHYDIVYTGLTGRVAHEFIIDCRPFEKSAHVTVEDIAKRLIDFGFHAPTMSWPVTGTLMVEPTESESKAELDRFCDAMITIRQEIDRVASGDWPADNNPLANAPHTIASVTADEWPHPYSRQTAVRPAPWLNDHKYWPAVARIDNPYGDRNLVCTCPPMDTF